MSTSLRRVRRLAILTLGCVGLAACGPEDGSRSRLTLVREVARPTLDTDTAWLGRTRFLRMDRSTGHLVGYNPGQNLVFEMTPEGELVRTYGGEGEGPGEVLNLSGLDVTADHVVALDVGNMKVVRFSRSGAGFREFAVDYLYRDLVARPDGELYLIPGADSFAVDVFTSDGRRVGGFGDRAHLPRSCSACQAVAIGSDRVAVVEPDRPELLVLDVAEGTRRHLDLSRTEVLARWIEEERERMARSGVPGGGKIWVSDLDALGDGRIVLAMIPPHVPERPRELWVVDATDEELARYSFDEGGIGWGIASGDSVIYATDVRDGRIAAYRIPR